MDLTAEFARHKKYLVMLAYRMLGSMEEAEDVVQEAFVRAQGASHDDIREPVAWLTRVVSRLALDQLKSARVRRNQYVGPWLPEPLVDPPAADPADRVTLDEQLTVAFLTVLESLSPSERAVYVLNEAFGVPLNEIADMLGRSPESCRQHASRARRRIRQGAPRFDADPAVHTRVVRAFHAACQTGDMEALAQLLDDNVVLRADGGGIVRAARVPVVGRDRVLQSVAQAFKQYRAAVFELRGVNGQLGMTGRFDDVPAVFSLVVSGGRITEIDAILNPDKLRRLPPVT
jgi:RNA polymerase sigma-70 factor (ECF subfamily)